MRFFLYGRLGLMIATVLCSLVAVSVKAETRPNIVVILADDLGYADTGFTGATDIKTPNLDQLAANGVQFDNAYVTHPYCGPSRAGLLTGRYQARFGMENNVSYSPYDPHMGLPLSEKTFAKRLQDVGYTTGIIGKWHLGAAQKYQPNQRGFDYFYGFLDGGHNYFPEGIRPNHDGYALPLIRNQRYTGLDKYLTTALSEEAANFIQRGATSEQPFMLYVAYNAPHTPLEAPKKTLAKYAHIDDKERRIYAAMVDEMDAGIGQIVASLKATGQFDNTLIFFLSDNGGVFPEAWQPTSDWADNSPYRRGKVALLEGGVKVPFIAHWPAIIDGGKRFEGLVSALDIAATSLALAGADVSQAKLDGVDLTPYMKGKKRGSPHKALFWRLEEADHLWAVRTPDYKYLRHTLPGVGLSFFDMRKDPTEQHNIVGEKPKQQAKLAKLWNEWNADNINNILQQSWEYKQTQKQRYDELFEMDKKAAAERNVYRIE